MKSSLIAILLLGSTSMTACSTMPPATPGSAVAARSLSAACGTYGFIDSDDDGVVTGDEWNRFRTGGFAAWDIDRNGGIDRDEFQNCYRNGGFYRTSNYRPDAWNGDWDSFDVNDDGVLSPDEFWSTSEWGRLDRNANGRIDADEWRR